MVFTLNSIYRGPKLKTDTSGDFCREDQMSNYDTSRAIHNQPNPPGISGLKELADIRFFAGLSILTPL